MPKVVVYLRVDEFRELEERVGDPAAWVRGVVRDAFLNRPERSKPRKVDVVQVVQSPYKPGFEPTVAFSPVAPSEPRVRCGQRDHMAPARKCVLEAGHGGAHTFH